MTDSGGAASHIEPVAAKAESVYRRIMRAITDWIASEGLEPGDRLPTEAEFSRRFDVNRLTVRQALAELSRAGVIRTVRGYGSFVAEISHRFSLSAESASVVARLRERGLDVTQELIAHTLVARDELPEPAALDVDHLVCMNTVTRVDGTPWSRSWTWLEHPRFAGIPAVWTPYTSATGLLAEAYGITLRRSWLSHAAVPAGPDDAEVLGIDIGAPLLLQTSVSVDQTGRPMLQAARRCRGDKIQFVVEL